jgi:hypothetical protein
MPPQGAGDFADRVELRPCFHDGHIVEGRCVAQLPRDACTRKWQRSLALREDLSGLLNQPVHVPVGDTLAFRAPPEAEIDLIQRQVRRNGIVVADALGY